jgi:hypothetical protein
MDVEAVRFGREQSRALDRVIFGDDELERRFEALAWQAK